MRLLRCFIALELPASLQEAIDIATEPARTRIGSDLVRWVPTGNVHLTLKFLGDTAPSGIESIKAALATEAEQYRPFDMSVRGFGAFPSSRKPRVLWVGITAPPVLASLQREVDVATARLGYNTEERPFSPHLTIGRVRQNITTSGIQKIRDEISNITIGDLGSVQVDAVHLFKSELQAGGSVYTRLYAAAFSRA